MQLMVHFAVGLVIGMFILSVVDLPPKREFIILMGCGLWGVVPDGHWMLRSLDLEGWASLWKSFHESIWANIFWFHQLIDRVETGNNNLEGAIAIGLIIVMSIVYASLNDWDRT